MAQKNDHPPSRRELFFPGWAVALLCLCGLVGFGWAGWKSGLLEGEAAAFNQALVYALIMGAVLNVILFAWFLWAWAAATAKQGRVTRYGEELGYLRAWGGAEARRRKAGLIRAVNALGAVPRDLENTVLAGADLRGANLAGCNLRAADLRRADLQGAVLDGANLWGAELSGANLSLVTLRGANLRGANLENAELVKAELDGANLHRANLVNANLYGTNLAHTRLDRARFAAPGQGGLAQQLHSSVEDWIRERLDEEGQYVGGGKEREG